MCSAKEMIERKKERGGGAGGVKQTNKNIIVISKLHKQEKSHVKLLSDLTSNSKTVDRARILTHN